MDKLLSDQALNALYTRYAESPTYRANFRAVYGAEYPEEVAPLSFVTMTLLRRIAQAVSLGPGATLIDLGCGRGGPGLWVARETGAALVGMDLSGAAVEQASRRVKEFNVEGRADFEVGDLTALRFADQTFDAAMSIDVLWMVPDKLAALREIARILKPQRRFAFTNWDFARFPPDYPPPVGDHRPLLREAGFTIEAYEEIPEAEAKQRAFYERNLAAKDALIREMGEAAQALIDDARRSLGLADGTDYLAHSRRIFVVARKG
jgi:ubiquinone/menaquinone biosynthesis C-methylase UbiE